MLTTCTAYGGHWFDAPARWCTYAAWSSETRVDLNGENACTAMLLIEPACDAAEKRVCAIERPGVGNVVTSVALNCFTRHLHDSHSLK